MLNSALCSLATVALACSAVAPGQINPPTVIKGTGPSGDVHSMTNNQNSLATLANGEVAALVYRQTSTTSGGHLTLAWSKDGMAWSDYYPLPNNTGHRMHEWNSGIMCAGRECDIVHVGWSDRSLGGTYHSVYYQTFNVMTRQWVGTPTRIATADAAKQQGVFSRDIAITPRGTVVIAVGVGANGGQGMGAWDCGLLVKKAGSATFSSLFPMRNASISGSLPWSREASIVLTDEVTHCAFKSLKGAGGMAYRSLDTETMAWQRPVEVMVGPAGNGIKGLNGINAGNKGMITVDTSGGLYITYITGSKGGLSNNNKMRMAYASSGTGGKNSDWSDLEILAHNDTVGSNSRGVGTSDPAYPQLQGGDTDYYNYTVCPGLGNAVFVVYSKPWEDFQNKYMQIWLDGVNQPFPTKEIQYWADTEPYVFERLGAMRNSGSLGHGAWIVYGKNDKPTPGQAPNGWVRMWLVTTTVGRTISYGTGCPGLGGITPRMRANPLNAPQIGVQYQLDIDRLPSRAFFTLMLGFNCQKLNLGFLGAPACHVDTDYPAVYPLQANAAGELQLAWVIPNSLSMVGLHLISQCVVFDYTAPGSVTTTNALRTIISD